MNRPSLEEVGQDKGRRISLTTFIWDHVFRFHNIWVFLARLFAAGSILSCSIISPSLGRNVELDIYSVTTQNFRLTFSVFFGKELYIKYWVLFVGLFGCGDSIEHMDLDLRGQWRVEVFRPTQNGCGIVPENRITYMKIDQPNSITGIEILTCNNQLCQFPKHHGSFAIAEKIPYQTTQGIVDLGETSDIDCKFETISTQTLYPLKTTKAEHF